MEAEIKYLYSLDVPELETYVPEESDAFSFNLRIIAGPKGQEGEESFDVQVVTPNWLLQHHGRSEVVVGRHLLIVFEYNWVRIRNRVYDLVRRCSGETWDEVGEKLSRIGHWEFEDYVPAPND